MRTGRGKSKRSGRSGNTSKLGRLEQAMKGIMWWRRSMRTDKSKSKRSRRSGNT